MSFKQAASRRMWSRKNSHAFRHPIKTAFTLTGSTISPSCWLQRLFRVAAVYLLDQEPRQFRNALSVRGSCVVINSSGAEAEQLYPWTNSGYSLYCWHHLTIGFLLINTIVVVEKITVFTDIDAAVLMAGFIVLLIASPTIVNYFDPDVRHIIVFVRDFLRSRACGFSFAALWLCCSYSLGVSFASPPTPNTITSLLRRYGLDGPRPTPLLAGRINKTRVE